jgi:hypothetical protein
MRYTICKSVWFACSADIRPARAGKLSYHSRILVIRTEEKRSWAVGKGGVNAIEDQ